jgi:hypothetical protein
MVFGLSDRETTTRQFPGVYTGKVENVIDPLMMGRIKVSIPAIFKSSSPENFVWARPCLPYGQFFIPNVGDQVWLAFENGDSRNPVWLGTWYAAGKVPTEASISPPLNRVIQTSTGNTIQINDLEQTIVIKNVSGNTITLDPTGTTLTDISGNTITLDAAGITLTDLNRSKLEITSLKKWLQDLVQVLSTWAKTPPPPTPDAGAALKTALMTDFKIDINILPM